MKLTEVQIAMIIASMRVKIRKELEALLVMDGDKINVSYTAAIVSGDMSGSLAILETK